MTHSQPAQQPAVQTGTAPGRIRSLDQFRGFTVLAMFVVNFLGGRDAVPAVLQHNENWFSLADWIMPGFLFAVGMSFRLTWEKRAGTIGKPAAVRGYARRSLVLVLVSLLAYGFGGGVDAWSAWDGPAVRGFVAALLKARLWEVLAIIGASQLLVLAVIGRGTGFRAAAAAGLVLLHAAISQVFNVHFVLARPNPLDAFWGAADARAWDGGFFGLLGWAAVMLAGTVAYDWLKAMPASAAARRFLAVGVVGILLGYAASCLSTLYDVPDADRGALPDVADSPVLPGGAPGELGFAGPPFTPVPPPDARQVNYWMMSKRLVSAPFVLFATGFVFAVLAAFVRACDLGRFESRAFAVLGANALAAYLIHGVVAAAVDPLLPGDAPPWAVLAGLVVFLWTTLAIMRELDRRNLYLRL